MFSHTAQYSDTIYLAMKDYGAEAEKLTAFVHQYSRSTGNRLLHELGLFTTEEMRHALTTCGLEVTYDDTSVTGRGLYIGQHVG